MVINSTYDIPYGGGYSACRRIVYIDRNIGDTFKAYDGQEYPLKPILVAHEIREVRLLKIFKRYNTAHRLSTYGDIALLLRLGVPIDEYYGHLHNSVEMALNRWKAGQAELPPDLDMLPYIEDGILVC